MRADHITARRLHLEHMWRMVRGSLNGANLLCMHNLHGVSGMLCSTMSMIVTGHAVSDTTMSMRLLDCHRMHFCMYDCWAACMNTLFSMCDANLPVSLTLWRGLWLR